MNNDLEKSGNIFIRVTLLCVLTCCLFLNVKSSSAQQNDPSIEGETGTKNETVQNQPWAPPPPPPDDFDWIQLTSGEWLKGELKVLYGKELEFDSDEMDLQKFDWEDVKQVQGHQVFSVLFEGPFTVDGLLQVTEDKVFVTVGEERKEYEHSKLIAIAPGEPKEINYWSAKINLGLNIAKGNTDQVNYNTKWDVRRRSGGVFGNSMLKEYLT